jgi:hypothetical protein
MTALANISRTSFLLAALALGCAPPQTKVVDASPTKQSVQTTQLAVAQAANPVSEEESSEESPHEAPKPQESEPEMPIGSGVRPALNDFAYDRGAAGRFGPRRVPTEQELADAQPVRPRGLPTRSNELTFDDLKFEIKPDQYFEDSMLTEQIKKLLNKSIRIRGFIYPTPRQSGIDRFILVRDNMECCFGPGAALYDCIYVEMAPGKTTNFSIAPITVEGVFSLQERKSPDGRQTSIFQLTAQSAK